MKFTKLSSFFLLATIALLPGCKKYPQPKVQDLKPLTQANAEFNATQNNIELKVKKFNEADCQELFGESGKNIVAGKTGYQPLQITVTNNSAQTITINESDIDLKIAKPKKAARTMQYTRGISTIGFIALAGTLGVITFGTLLWAGAILGLGFSYSTASVGTIIAASSVLVVSLVTALGAITTPFVGIYRDVKKSQVNKQIEYGVTIKGLKELAVESGQTTNALIFVKKRDFRPNFTVTIKQTETISAFNVKLDNAPFIKE